MRNVISNDCDLNDIEFEEQLRIISEMSVGISGRTLRKIPILAHAFYTDHNFEGARDAIPLPEFMEAMRRAVLKYTLDSRHIKQTIENGCAKENLNWIKLLEETNL